MEQVGKQRRLSFDMLHEKLEGDASKLTIRMIWLAAVVALIVSIWVNVGSDEMGGIYLRATCILYLSLSISVEGNVARSVRAAAGSIIIILAVGGLSTSLDNIPLYFATGLVLLHMVACILTFGAGKLVGVSGIRGLGFVLLGISASTVCIFVSLYSYLESWTVEQTISFGTVGIPLLVLGNGIPKSSSNQIIACYAVLGPCAACMYSLSALTNFAPWIVLLMGVTSGSAAAMLCVTAHKTWKETTRGMMTFALSSKVSALLVLMLLTFGNIATINGWSTGNEDRVQITDTTVLSLSTIQSASLQTNISSSFNNSVYLDLAQSRLDRFIGQDNCAKIHHFALASKEIASNKAFEELIPLLLMGLAKGAVVTVLILTMHSDKDEANAWAAGSVLGLSAIIWLTSEGRGRCLKQNPDVCDPYRSGGFIAGLSICGGGILICLIRALHSSIIIPYEMNKEERRAGEVLKDKVISETGCCTRYHQYLHRKITNRDSGMALATTALLVCLIASSTCTITQEGAVPRCGRLLSATGELCTMRKSFIGTLNEITANGLNLTTAESIDAMNDLIADTAGMCNTNLTSNFLSSLPGGWIFDLTYDTDSVTTSILNNRVTELEDYWAHTAWMIASAAAVLALLAVESLPKSPSVGIALSTGLLMAAGLVHYSCLMAHLNSRLSPTGLKMEYNININVYIVSIISVIIGLAWGVAVVNGTGKDCKKLPSPLIETDTEVPAFSDILFEVTFEEDDSSREDEFRMMKSANLLDSYIKCGFIENYQTSEEKDSYGHLYWSAIGRSCLSCGVYEPSNNPIAMAKIARSACNNMGRFRGRHNGEKGWAIICD